MEQAMRLAHYELMENGRIFGTVPPCKGLWAEGKTLEKCREELQSTLEDWLLLGLQMGHSLPVIDGVNSRSGGTGRIREESIRSW
jgi:predicted RNase H-like HicB family nuclease